MTAGEYQNVTGSKWSRYAESIGAIKNSNLLFIRPYDYYLNWKSLNFNNSYGTTTYPVYDVAFNDIEVFKLMKNIYRRQDIYTPPVSYGWTSYNYQQDSQD
jgi:hypothetical protein